MGLSDTQKLQAEKSYKERKGFGGDTSPNYPDRIYREVRVTPLLIIHLLAIGDRDQKDLYESHPVVAWSISFPKTSQEEKKVKYVANTAWFQEGYKIEDEDEAGGDDE